MTSTECNPWTMDREPPEPPVRMTRPLDGTHKRDGGPIAGEGGCSGAEEGR
jgi:hypothetical protein